MLAVLAVSDKRGIAPFATGLLDLGWTVVATDGTSAAVADSRLGRIADLAGVPTLFGGRLKTLTVSVMAGILARDTPEDRVEMREHGVTRVDLVACNFYQLPGRAAGLTDFCEKIDIGGPAMLRGAAKNCARVIPLTDPDDYPEVLAALRIAGGEPSVVGLRTRIDLAAKAFQASRDYDAAVYALLDSVP